MLIYLYILLGLAAIFILIVVEVTAIFALISAAPWAPTKPQDIRRIINLAQIKTGQVVYDLGCGDARVALALAQTGAKVIGVEYSLANWLWSAYRARRQKNLKIKIIYHNFFNLDLRSADLIYCYLTPWGMKKLGEKFKQELPVGAKIISYRFSIPGWSPVRVDRPNLAAVPIFIYHKT